MAIVRVTTPQTSRWLCHCGWSGGSDRVVGHSIDCPGGPKRVWQRRIVFRIEEPADGDR